MTECSTASWSGFSFGLERANWIFGGGGFAKYHATKMSSRTWSSAETTIAIVACRRSGTPRSYRPSPVTWTAKARPAA